MASDRSVIVADHGPVRVITIDRPARRNAVDRATAAALVDAFGAFDRDPEVAVAILTEAGGTFCSGAVRLPRLIGHSRAMDLILAGRGVSGDEALAMGLLNRLTEPGLALAGAIASGESGQGAASFAAGAGRHGQSPS